MWVSDDPRVRRDRGLPVAAVVEMINHLVRRIANAENVVAITYCFEPFRRAIGAGERHVLTSWEDRRNENDAASDQMEVLIGKDCLAGSWFSRVGLVRFASSRRLNHWKWRQSSRGRPKTP